MDKILKRIGLLFSFYEPMELYLGFAVVAIFSALIVLLSSRIYFHRKKEFKFTLLSIPSFCAIAPAVFSIFTLISGRVNIFTCAAAILAGFLLNCYFVRGACGSGETYLCFGRDNKKGADTPRFVLYGGLFLISAIYLFSIDHNWVPAQYDVTSYQFIGDLLFRKNVYPIIPFAGNNTITILVPPGYFIYDFVSRLLWNSPRADMLMSVFFFVASSIAFIRLGSLVFKARKIEPFMLLALLTRGLFWNFWEFNLPRAVALISSIMFLCALIKFYRAAALKKAVVHVFFAQIFLSSAILTQPQHCAYILAGVFGLVTILFLARIFKNRGFERKKSFIFFVSLLIPAVLFCLWYFSVVAKYSPASYLLGQSQAPIPKITGLLFHFNGVMPILLTLITGGVLAYNKRQRSWAAVIGFLFIFALGLSYFQGLMAKALPESFKLVDLGRVDDFTSARYFVKTPVPNPTSIISKMISFWWFAVVAMGWAFFSFWGRLKGKIPRIGFIIVITAVLSADVLFMYYNKPIIKKNEYLFLKKLEKSLPQEAVIVAPPGYQFSAWTGPALHRDSISNRASTVHSVNSLPEDISDEAARVYKKEADFKKLFNSLPAEKTFILFNEPYSRAAQRLLKDNNWQLILNEGGDYCFKYKGKIAEKRKR